MSATARRLPIPFGRFGRRPSAAQQPDDQAVAKEEISVASQWRLMWLKLRRHKLAMIGMVTVGLLYLMVAINGFIAPYSTDTRSQYPFAAPNGIHFFRDGSFDPYVYGRTMKADPATMTRTIVMDKSTTYDVDFIARGHEYEILGLFSSNWHLFQVEQGGSAFLFGTDSLGRDIFSRTLNGATISLSIGLVGVAISFVLGAVIGGFSGYYSGAFDTVVQRFIEFLSSIPTIPLYLALSAAIPQEWSQLQVYFTISIILSIQAWPGIARVVRGKLLQLREEDFVLDAQLAGASAWRIVVVHMLPAFASFLIVQLTLSVPGMILSETALSYLGLGLQDPIVSWGVLIQEAQNVQAILLYPWLLIPGIFIVVTVLAFNFFGDGLRDAADPYKS